MIEQASVDARRRLVLIRRDGVEHLIMTGGPVDVVIETGIQARRSSPAAEAPAERSPPSSRASRAVSVKPSTNEPRVSPASASRPSRRAPGCDRMASRRGRAGAGAAVAAARSPPRRSREPAKPATLPPAVADERDAPDERDRVRRKDDPAPGRARGGARGAARQCRDDPLGVGRHRRDAASAARRRQIPDREARARRPARTARRRRRRLPPSARA